MNKIRESSFYLLTLHDLSIHSPFLPYSFSIIQPSIDLDPRSIVFLPSLVPMPPPNLCLLPGSLTLCRGAPPPPLPHTLTFPFCLPLPGYLTGVGSLLLPHPLLSLPLVFGLHAPASFCSSFSYWGKRKHVPFLPFSSGSVGLGFPISHSL